MSTFLDLNLPDQYNASEILFHNLDAGRGDKIAIYFGDQTFTYAQIAEQANRAGNLLRNLGVAPGSRFMMVMLDTPAFPAVFFGAVKAGCIPIVANTNLPSSDLEYFVNDSEAQVVIVDASLYPKIAEVRANCPTLRHVVVAGGNGEPDALSYETLMAAASPQLAAHPTRQDDMAYWMYSSGSTGRPKGVVHIQSDIRYSIEAYAKEFLRYTEADIAYSVPKLFFAYGFGNAMTFPFAVGASAVLDPHGPDPKRIYDNIERYRPTLFFGVPTLYIALLNQPDAPQRQLDSLRFCGTAAESLPPEIYYRWKSYYGLELCEGCGSTEMTHIYVSNYPGRTKPGSAGVAVPGYAVKLVSATDDSSEITEPYATGVMMVSGPSGARYYWNRPDKTAHTMRNGWLYTDDLFYRDEDGFYFFAGRDNDIFKVSGQWVAPPEVEATLLEHPAVFESAVVPHRDESSLTRTKAFIILKQGFDASPDLVKELQDHVKARIAPYKYPRFIEFVDDLPRTATGKLLRSELKHR